MVSTRKQKFPRKLLSFCFHRNEHDVTLFKQNQQQKQIHQVIIDNIHDFDALDLYIDTGFVSLDSIYRNQYITNMKQPGTSHFGVGGLNPGWRPKSCIMGPLVYFSGLLVPVNISVDYLIVSVAQTEPKKSTCH